MWVSLDGAPSLYSCLLCAQSFHSMEVGIQDAPRPREILFALLMGTGGRVHSRLGGLLKEKVSVHDGQR